MIAINDNHVCLCLCADDGSRGSDGGGGAGGGGGGAGGRRRRGGSGGGGMIAEIAYSQRHQTLLDEVYNNFMRGDFMVCPICYHWLELRAIGLPDHDFLDDPDYVRERTRQVIVWQPANKVLSYSSIHPCTPALTAFAWCMLLTAIHRRRLLLPRWSVCRRISQRVDFLLVSHCIMTSMVRRAHGWRWCVLRMGGCAWLGTARRF